METGQPPIDLDRYFKRIAFHGTPAPDFATLRALHFAHCTHVPFENIDPLFGRGTKIDPASLQAKIIDAHRGGYCFEQNGLFTFVLEQIGFVVTRLSARVRFGTQRVLPRTHMVELVELDGRTWFCDVGFGGWGIFEPVELIADREVRQFGWTFSFRREGEYWVLQCPECPYGADQYAFTLEPQLPVDYEPPNHYCATHPDSRFVQMLTAQLPTPEARYILRNRELVTVTPETATVEPLETDKAVLHVLEKRFGIILPAETEFGPLPRPQAGA